MALPEPVDGSRRNRVTVAMVTQQSLAARTVMSIHALSSRAHFSPFRTCSRNLDRWSWSRVSKSWWRSTCLIAKGVRAARKSSGKSEANHAPRVISDEQSKVRARRLLQGRSERLDHQPRLLKHESIIHLAHRVDGISELQVRELELLCKVSIALRLNSGNRARRFRFQPSGDEVRPHRAANMGRSPALCSR